MKYLGLDAHSKTCEVAAVDERGKVLRNRSFETSEHELIEEIRAISGRKALAVEECPLASWVHAIIKPYVDELIVCDPKQNKWIAASEGKDDRVDAIKLAQLLKGGYLKPVYHSDDGRQKFKELVLHYHDLSRQVTRFKNKIKAKFRRNGIRCDGNEIYTPGNREGWLKKLGHKETAFAVENLYFGLDSVTTLKQRAKREIVKMAPRYPEIRLFKGIPGVGLIVASTVSAIVATPSRFSKKSKLWTYAGLGIKRRSSADVSSPAHLNRNYNRTLKYVLKLAATRAISKANNEFATKYKTLCDRGLDPSVAKVTVARSILSAMYGMWKKGEAYRPRTDNESSLN